MKRLFQMVVTVEIDTEVAQYEVSEDSVTQAVSDGVATQPELYEISIEDVMEIQARS